jgi:alkylated DNA repair dioxygenase AlkB
MIGVHDSIFDTLKTLVFNKIGQCCSHLVVNHGADYIGAHHDKSRTLLQDLLLTLSLGDSRCGGQTNQRLAQTSRGEYRLE